jgi:hypothetical protein
LNGKRIKDGGGVLWVFGIGVLVVVVILWCMTARGCQNFKLVSGVGLSVLVVLKECRVMNWSKLNAGNLVNLSFPISPSP